MKFLSVKDVRQFEIDFENSKFISEAEADFLDKRCKPQLDDILLTKIGTFGFASVIGSNERFQIFVSVALLRPDKNIVIPKFLALCVNSNLVYLQFERVIKGAGVPDLHLEDIREIEIPVPPIEIQKQIVEKFETAYQGKRAKEGEAKELLAGIDAYLLDKLGIKPPTTEQPTKKTFFTALSKITGNRFDASSYKPTFDFSSSKYKTDKLSKVAIINPNITFDKLDNESEISFVPMEVINENNGTIDELRSKRIKESKGFTKFQENDLIWAKITPCMQNGKSAIARNLKQGVACGSTEFYVIRPRSNNILIDYLHILLRNKRVLDNAQNFFGGSAGHQRVSIDFLKNLLIPLPPLEVQEEIASHIQNIRERAKQLETEAKAEIERAKAEVEAMILGK